MTLLTRPVLEISLAAVLANYQELQKLAAGSVAAAVVKDDAYGLGAEKVAAYLYRHGNCRSFLWLTRSKAPKSARLSPMLKSMCCKAWAMTILSCLPLPA